MKFSKALALASAAFLAFASPAAAQMQGGPFQNGTPLAPSVTGSDASAGFSFLPNDTQVSGHLGAGAGTGDVPVLSACGGTVAGDAGSTDFAGTATQGGTVTTCTITFGTAFTAKPACIVSDLTGSRASMGSVATATAITVTGITAADAIAWLCVAKSGG